MKIKVSGWAEDEDLTSHWLDAEISADELSEIIQEHFKKNGWKYVEVYEVSIESVRIA